MTTHGKMNYLLGQTAGFFMILAVLATPNALAQEAPDFTIETPKLVTDAITKEAGLALNTDEPEVLFVTYDTFNMGGFIDPITGQEPLIALTGRFFNTETLEPTSENFIIFGNPNSADMETLDVRFNPVSNQYIVAGKADGRGANGANIPLVAIVNPVSAGGNVVKAFAVDEDSEVNYDDVALGCSVNNGNFLLVAERDMPGSNDGEGAAGYLFDQDGNLLTEDFGRLDTAQIGTGNDVDDPDVDFLPNNNVFLYLHNTDSDGLWENRVTGVVVQPEPDAEGKLVASSEQLLSQDRLGSRQGHPAAIENPFTSELIGAFDYGNGDDGGDVFFFNVGDAPDYDLTVSQDQIPYLEASGSNPIDHRHPQLAADPNSGVIILVYNVNDGSTVQDYHGILFTLLGSDGQPLPGNGNELPNVGPAPTYQLDETEFGFIDNSANYYNVAYDEYTDSFLIVYATKEPYTKVARIVINSDHMPTSGMDSWMMY